MKNGGAWCDIEFILIETWWVHFPCNLQEPPITNKKLYYSQSTLKTFREFRCKAFVIHESSQLQITSY